MSKNIYRWFNSDELKAVDLENGTLMVLLVLALFSGHSWKVHASCPEHLGRTEGSGITIQKDTPSWSVKAVSPQQGHYEYRLNTHPYEILTELPPVDELELQEFLEMRFSMWKSYNDALEKKQAEMSAMGKSCFISSFELPPTPLGFTFRHPGRVVFCILDGKEKVDTRPPPSVEKRLLALLTKTADAIAAQDHVRELSILAQEILPHLMITDRKGREGIDQASRFHPDLRPYSTLDVWRGEASFFTLEGSQVALQLKDKNEAVVVNNFGNPKKGIPKALHSSPLTTEEEIGKEVDDDDPNLRFFVRVTPDYEFLEKILENRRSP